MTIRTTTDPTDSRMRARWNAKDSAPIRAIRVCSSFPQAIANRNVLDPTDEAGAQPFDRAGELNVFQARGQMAEDGAQLEARQVRSQTEMLADAEREVRIHPPIDTEAK